MQELDTEKTDENLTQELSDHDLMLQHVIGDNHELFYMDAYLSEYLN